MSIFDGFDILTRNQLSDAALEMQENFDDELEGALESAKKGPDDVELDADDVDFILGKTEDDDDPIVIEEEEEEDEDANESFLDGVSDDEKFEAAIEALNASLEETPDPSGSLLGADDEDEPAMDDDDVMLELDDEDFEDDIDDPDESGFEEEKLDDDDSEDFSDEADDD